MAHFTRFPALNIYAATKSFNFGFSERMASLNRERLDVLRATPGLTLSNMVRIQTPFTITSEAHAQGTLKHLGIYEHSFGHWRHEFYQWFGQTRLALRIYLKKRA